jgi:hypothetical protein
VGEWKADITGLFSSTFNPVRASHGAASSAIPAHPATNVIDGFKNTFWAADLTKDPQPTLVLTFAAPVNIDHMLVTSGDSDSFLAQPRPKQLHIVFSNGSSQDVTLEDKQTPQDITLNGAHGIATMEVHITAVFPAVNGNDVALTELEFFTKP